MVTVLVLVCVCVGGWVLFDSGRSLSSFRVLNDVTYNYQG